LPESFYACGYGESLKCLQGRLVKKIKNNQLNNAMQNPTEISVLDWLREKFRNPRKLLRELWARPESAQSAAKSVDETIGILPTGEQEAAPLPSPITLTAESPGNAPISAVSTVETITTQSRWGPGRHQRRNPARNNADDYHPGPTAR
jgi:hypothetical protein